MEYGDATFEIRSLGGDLLCIVEANCGVTVSELRDAISRSIHVSESDQLMFGSALLTNMDEQPFTHVQCERITIDLMRREPKASLAENLANRLWDGVSDSSCAIYELSFCGRVAVPYLEDALQHKSDFVRSCAVDGLGRCRDASAVPGLTSALCQDNADVRKAALRALGHIGNSGLPLIARALHDVDEGVRTLAANTLPAGASDIFGQQSGSVVERLVFCATDCLQEPDKNLEKNAMLFALARFGGLGTNAALEFASEFEHLLAAGEDSLAAIGHLDSPGVARISEFGHSLAAIGHLGSAGVCFADRISEFVRQRLNQSRHTLRYSLDIRWRALDTLSRMRDADPASVPNCALIAERLAEILMNDDELLLREKAATVLSRLGPAGAHGLSMALYCHNATVRAMAARWLGHVPNLQANIVDELLDLAVSDDNAETCVYAAEAVARTGNVSGLALLRIFAECMDIKATLATTSLALLSDPDCSDEFTKPAC